MKLTMIFMLAALLQVSAAGYSQQINLSYRNVPLEKALQEVKKQSGYNFLYNVQMLKEAKPVNLRLKNASLEEALEQCFEGQSLTYTVNQKTVVVKRKPVAEATVAVPPTTIRGKVVDSKGEGMPGVTINLKGTTVATASAGDGSFSLQVPEGTGTLVFTFIGFQTKEIAFNGPADLNIQLQEDNQALKEVVVVGYGQQEREDVTSAISSFKPDEQNSRPVLGPDQLIQGRMPGVNVSSGSGSPGSSTRVSIRGIGSLSASNEPLYVIDGIPVVPHNAALFNLGENMNPLSQLNPNDIESIEVLKDAASSAIYGSRATNGVIIITTKSGKQGKSNLNFDYYTGIQDVPNRHKMKMAGSDLYLEVINEGIDNYNQQFGYKLGDANYMLRKENPYPGMPDTDWFDLVTRTARTSSYNLSFSGGTEKTKVFVSGNYLDQEGTIISSEFKKYTGKVNLSHKLFNWLEVGTNSNLSYTHNSRVPGSNSGATVMARSIPQRPFDRPYKPNGEYYVGGTEDLLYHNPLHILNEEDADIENYRYLGTFFANLHLGKGLDFKTSLGLDQIYTVDKVYYNEDHPYGTGVGRLIDSRRMISNLLVENTLSYNKQFGELSFSALAGQSYQKTSNSGINIDGRGFPSTSFDVLSVAAEITEAGTSLAESALASYFGRTSFSYKDKYLLSLTFRADGSSKFAPENRFGYFPSVSAGWHISRESFFLVELMDLKLRASYGSTGNQDGISSYAYQAQMSGGRNYGYQSGIGVSTNGNRDLTWESADQFDVGVDMGFQRGKYTFTADYFVKNTNNLLYSRPTQATSGFTSITSNIGSMRNWGWEFMVGTNQTFGELTWSSDFNISFIKNKLTSLLGDEALLIGANRTLKVGEEVGSFYLYKMLGIYQTDEEIPEKFYAQGIRAGDVKYDDINNDGLINADDRQIVGTSNPNFFGGWNNTFQYKNFDLSVFLNYSQGADVYFSGRITVERLANNFFGIREEVAKERWTGPGTSNTTPRAIYGTGWNTQNSTRFLEDGSFLRLRSVILGYTLPTSFTSKIKLSRVRVYAQADNLFLWTNYSGMDPEVTSNFDPQFMGEDNLILPQLRTVNVGVNLRF
ncbi:SusC/RagA family TonB-linked outer membrane protein [Rufibacter immobilis]|uniref:SusC/RagA family TonB-linked outer membrane protein n=1 Tax=Rufibacter immobilis TaxID=1348778 RepID=A0A3M9MWU1_9BACT|nr:TonB-dependent receptor [Rufibacter immobilis]RNI29989.1 SusC/RagA family TonB-linked outer membrane protein [Rufibacter immobilis]